MSAATRIKSGGVVTVSIKSNGNTIPEAYEIYSITISKAINRISSAEIIILDGNAAEETFAVSSSDQFVPGVEISIEAGYDSNNTVVFSGIVTKQTIRIDDEVGSALCVECRDKAIKMTVGRKSASFSKITDSDVISKLIGNAGLAKNVTSTSAQISELIQYYSTDWDFMLTRAEVNGLIVSTINGKVSVFKHDENTEPVLTVCNGKDIYSINADMNAVSQLGGVKASAWDYKNQALVTAQVTNNNSGPGNISSKKLSEVVGLSEYELQTTASVDNENLTNWAQAQMLKSEYSKIVGEVQCQGTANVEPGYYITLAGLGSRFNGNHLVSEISHSIAGGNWVSDIGFGLSQNWFSEAPDIMAPPAAGLLPGVRGLYNGTVKKNYDDSESEYRILVDLPLFDSSGEGIWARLSNFYSTSSKGAFFLPEVGDEVIVGFLNDDPRFPIILGSLYSNKNKPYSELNPNEKNSKKAIVTKSELRIIFDDENQILTAMTPKNNQMVLDDKNQQIKINDQNNNSILMDSSGITIKSPKDINLQADNNVVIKGSMGINIEASGGDVKTSGANVKQMAEEQYTAEGGMTASVQGGDELSLSATMVMIN